MSEFGNRSGEGGNDFYVPDLGDFDSFELISDQQAELPVYDYVAENYPIDPSEDPYERFERMCNLQDVEPIDALRYESIGRNLAACYSFPKDDPSINRTVAVAGIKLREDPNIQLAKQPITLPAEHDIPMHKTAMQTLEGMINSSIERPPAEQLPKHQFVSDKLKPLSMCDRVEPTFDKAVPRFRYRGNSEQVTYQAIIDDNQELLAVRKHVLDCGSMSRPSVLTFQEVAIDGISYPPGSIMRLQLESDWPAQKYTVFEHVNPSPPRVVSSSEVERATFMRLANGFAGNPENINKYAKRTMRDLKRLGEID